MSSFTDKGYMSAAEFNEAKRQIKEAIRKRDGIGTGGEAEDVKPYGDLSYQESSVVDKADDANVYEPIKIEQGQNTYGLLHDDFNNGLIHNYGPEEYNETDLSNPQISKIIKKFAYPHIYEPIPSNFNLEFMSRICERLNKEKADSNGSADGLDTSDESDNGQWVTTKKLSPSPEISSCNNLCSGLCVGSCLSFCNVCRGCTSSCGTGCSTGCNIGCQGSCWSDCGGGATMKQGPTNAGTPDAEPGSTGSGESDESEGE